MKANTLGILSAVAASVCCLGPIMLVLLGLGSLGLGAVLGRYHWYFLLTTMALLAFGWRNYAQERRRCQTAGCQMAQAGVTKGILTAASIVVMTLIGLNLLTYANQRHGAVHPTSGVARGASQVILPIEGMTCFTCQLAVESAVKKLPGVREALADVTRQRATISYDPQQITVSQLIEAINNTGYRAKSPIEGGDS